MLDEFLGAADTVLTVEYAFNDVRPRGLVYSQYRVLRLLEKDETLKKIAEKRKISQQATGKALAGLVTFGFATKKVHPRGTPNVDRRESSISVTSKGKEALVFAEKRLNAIIDKVEK